MIFQTCIWKLTHISQDLKSCACGNLLVMIDKIIAALHVSSSPAQIQFNEPYFVGHIEKSVRFNFPNCCFSSWCYRSSCEDFDRFSEMWFQPPICCSFLPACCSRKFQIQYLNQSLLKLHYTFQSFGLTLCLQYEIHYIIFGCLLEVVLQVVLKVSTIE